MTTPTGRHTPTIRWPWRLRNKGCSGALTTGQAGHVASDGGFRAPDRSAGSGLRQGWPSYRRAERLRPGRVRFQSHSFALPRCQPLRTRRWQAPRGAKFAVLRRVLPARRYGWRCHPMRSAQPTDAAMFPTSAPLAGRMRLVPYPSPFQGTPTVVIIADSALDWAWKAVQIYLKSDYLRSPGPKGGETAFPDRPRPRQKDRGLRPERPELARQNRRSVASRTRSKRSDGPDRSVPDVPRSSRRDKSAAFSSTRRLRSVSITPIKRGAP